MSGDDASVVEAVRVAIAPIADAHGLDLEAIDISIAGRHRRLGIAVDRDGGIDLDAIAEVSGEMSRALDDLAVLGDGPYTLEVSSPGIDRPLTHPRHWRRNIGRLVEVTLVDGGRRSGRIARSDDTGVTLVDPALTDVSDEALEGVALEGAEVATLGWDEIDRGHIQIDFGRGRGDR